ncbi:MAG: Holliday junction branch migration protein RuvA [Parasporobacterium sp.]|nr:Holliday junction branch migration protein RuvA [Parasporobacterium sp.]
MISFIKGTISYIGDSFVILECNHMGFQISMPSTALFRLNEGMEVTVYTHLAVKEDDLSLYGFLGMDDLQMFKQLITVSGVGPKGALQILSSISTEELKMAIASGDAKLISSAKGIGLKTAQKLVVDLKGRFKNELPVSEISSGKLNSSNLEMAVLFAQSTGISRTQCMNALSKTKLPDDADVDLIIDSIFKNLNF